jgi:hypothetical protein
MAAGETRKDSAISVSRPIGLVSAVTKMNVHNASTNIAVPERPRLSARGGTTVAGRVTTSF